MEQKEIVTPNVFVSHASEDKERFVLAFAKKLLDNGINPWVDKWEMHPGDQLVDKIFEVGIGGAQAILIILSRNSIEKPWVREELNASFVERINKGTKLIPIVLDDCSIPKALQSTLYEKIANLDDYEASLKNIVDAIYEHSDKPPLGSPPSYIHTALERIPGLTRIDNLLLKLAGDKAIENGLRHTIQTQEMLEKATMQDVPRRNFYESLVILGDSEYLELRRFFGNEPSEPELREITRGGVPFFSITSYGFEQYIKAYIPDYNLVIRGVILQIVNYSKNDSVSIASALSQPPLVVEHVLDRLNERGLIHLLKEGGLNTTRFINPSPGLKRLLDEDVKEE